MVERGGELLLLKFFQPSELILKLEDQSLETGFNETWRVWQPPHPNNFKF